MPTETIEAPATPAVADIPAPPKPDDLTDQDIIHGLADAVYRTRRADTLPGMILEARSVERRLGILQQRAKDDPTRTARLRDKEGKYGPPRSLQWWVEKLTEPNFSLSKFAADNRTKA